MPEQSSNMPPLIGSRGMTVPRIRSFAQAAAEFWNARPWQYFKGEKAWEISPRPRTRAMRACIVAGFTEDAVGLGFLPSGFDLYQLSSQPTIEGHPTTFRHTFWSVHFASLPTAPVEDSLLWSRERLPLADIKAFAIPTGVTRWGRNIRPSTDQLNLMEALMRIFASMTSTEACGLPGTRISRRVKTFDGPVSLTLSIAVSVEPTDPVDSTGSSSADQSD